MKKTKRSEMKKRRENEEERNAEECEGRAGFSCWPEEQHVDQSNSRKSERTSFVV
jgi:hypothetical protein